MPHPNHPPMSAHAPPPDLQQPLVPQQVSTPSSGTAVTTATGPPGSVPITPLPPASANSVAQFQPPGSVEGRGTMAASVPDIGASQLGMPSVEGSLAGVDPLQARLERLNLQPPEGALPQQGEFAASANQLSQPINGPPHSLHQMEPKYGVAEPAPSETGSKEANGVTKHSDLLSDLDPLWNFQKI